LRTHNKQYEPVSFGQPESTEQARKSKLSICDFMHATEGSEALDLATEMPLKLSSKLEYYKLTSGVYSPLPLGSLEIILGRSGLISQGPILHPSIVDGYSKEEISIMAYVRKEIQIDAGGRIAQLFCFLTLRARPLQ
jgi:dUTPase